MRLDYETQEYEADETEKYIRIERVDIVLRLIIWVILGMVFPIAGWVFWGMWKETHPDIAEAIAGGAKTTIFTLILYVILSIIWSLLAVGTLQTIKPWG